MNSTFSSTDKLLIINADDFGMCHSNNVAIMELLQKRLVSSATLMIPCSWSIEAAEWASKHPEIDIGVHLTFTSEWKTYKWGPITRDQSTESLVTSEGFFPEDCRSVELDAVKEEVRTEIIHQIETAKMLGIDPTHLDNHMGSLYGLQTGQDFLDVVLDICALYQLPFRLPRSYAYAKEGQIPPELQQLALERVRQADEKGVVIIDYLLSLPYEYKDGDDYMGLKQQMIDLLTNLNSGISEIYMHPSQASDELKAMNPFWKKREMEFELLRDPDIQAIIKSENIQLINWRTLRDWQREELKNR